MTMPLSRSTLLGIPTTTGTNLGQACFSDPAILDLCVYRGDTGRIRVTLTDSLGAPLDLTGATWDADVRGLDGTSKGSFTVTPTAEPGVVELILTKTLSESLAPGEPLVWDLEMTKGGEITTIMGGNVTVTADVSRATP